MTKEKCIIYVRVSDPSQVDGTSLDTQEEKCREYATREGFEVAKVFREEGVSAKMWQRPEFMRALDFLKEKKGQVGYVVMYKIDRISRNLEDQYIILKALREAGAEMRSASENIDDTPAGQLLRNMLWAFADFDNKVRAERCYMGSKARFIQGYWTHTPPPGYMMVRDPITKRSLPTPISEQAKHISWAFERRCDNWSFDKIADGMNKRGYRTKNGKKVKGSYVERLIKHPFYMGLMRSYGEEIEGKHEPLVSKALWYKAQQINNESTHKLPIRQLINPLFPLRGLAYCSICNTKLTGSAPKGKSKKYPYYHHGSHKCCVARNIPKEELENIFIGQLQKLEPKPEIFNLARQVILDEWKQRVASNIKQEKNINGRITELKNEKASLLELKRKNPYLYTDEEFLEQKHGLDKQINALELERNDESAIDKNFEQALEVAFSLLKNPVSNWQQLESHAKHKFQHILFS